MSKPRTRTRRSLFAFSALAIALGWAVSHAATPPVPAFVASAAASAQDDMDADFEDGDLEEEDFQEGDVEEDDAQDEEDLVEDDAQDEEDLVEDDVEEEDDLGEEVDLEEDEGSIDDDVDLDDLDDQADDGAELDDSADGADDADEDDPALDDADGSDEGAGDEEEFVDDYSDDSWASGWDIEDADPSDDAIPLDDSLPEGTVWEVAVPADSEWVESEGDSFAIGSLVPVRTGRKPERGSAPRPSRRPGDDDDVVYAAGGLPIAAVSVPWQAQIFYPGAPAKPDDKRAAWQRQHYCGGALVAPDWVVTAAHCIDQQRVDLGFKVRLGAQDLAKGDGVTYRIDRIVRHSQYNADSSDVSKPPNMYANDIAMVRIVPEAKPAPAVAGRIRPIPINRTPLADGIPVSVTGWGVTGVDAADAINAVMLRVDLQLMANAVCQARKGYGPQKVKGSVFCASNPKQSTCRGDSGGPVVLTNTQPQTRGKADPLLVGVVSWGKRKCAGDGNPGVYTRVDQYAQWMEQAMKLPAGRNSLP